MADRLNELKGNVKEGAGHLTGDRELEAEGQSEADAARASRHVKGAGNEVKGNVKEGLGHLTGDESLRASGEADRLKGRVQRTD